MFALVSILMVIVFCVVTVLLPYRFPETLGILVQFTRRKLVGETNEAAFASRVPEDIRISGMTRIWGGCSVALLVGFALADGTLLINHPASIAAAVGYGFLAMATSAVLLIAIVALESYRTRLQTDDAAVHSGLLGLWVVDSLDGNRKLEVDLGYRVQSSSKVCIVDVTGYELLGKGMGNSILYDALDNARDVPVYLLLCKPDARAVDPEKRKVSVLQGLLAEMNISQPTFLRRVSMTMDAVEALNEGREPAARIRVRFYSEKPTFRSVILDDSCLAIPWHPREDRGRIPYLDIARSAENTSFYESYRRHFGRLWGIPLSATDTHPNKRNLPDRAVSGSFAVRPAGVSKRQVSQQAQEAQRAQQATAGQ